MKEKVIFYLEEYNCSQCMLKAAETVYNIKINDEFLEMCSAINLGFGIGSMCCCIIACVMILGALFDKQTASRLRIKLLSEIYSSYDSLNCANLKSQCNECFVGNLAEILETIINEEQALLDEEKTSVNQ